MKKNFVFPYLLTATIIFLASTFLWGCNEKEEPVNDCDAKIAESYNSGNWTGGVSYELAINMSENYQKDNGKKYIWNGDTRTEEKDAQCVWFPLDEIKKYLRAIEKGDCEKKCGDSLGIRIYYAKYPDEKAWAGSPFSDELANNVTPDYADHHTVFFVPTYYDKQSGTHIDFNPFGKECKNPFVVTNPKNNFIFMVGKAKNHGSLIPPNAPEGASFIRE